MSLYRIPQRRCKLVGDGSVRLAQRSVENTDEVGRVLVDYYRRLALPHERIVALLLNGRNAITALVKVSEGGMHGAALKSSDVLRPVLIGGADAFVLAHNHPSGDPEPSADDRAMTVQLLDACDSVGVSMFDHIVVGGEQFRAIVGDAVVGGAA